MGRGSPRRRFLAVLLVAPALGPAGCGPGEVPALPAGVEGARVVTLYVGARLVPGDGSPPIERSSLLVADSTIVSVGAEGEIEAPRGAGVVDLSGFSVIPALIGAHGHPGYQEGGTFSSEVYSGEVLRDDLRRAAYFGVGTVVSLGIDPDSLAFSVRDDAAGGRGMARLLTAGRGIGAPNAGPGFATWAGIAYEVTTPEAGRAAVRELAARGVDAVKIWVDDRGGRAPALAPPVYRAIIDEARGLGHGVTAHVFRHADAVDLVEAGVHGFAHMPRDSVVTDELATAIVAAGVYVMPNLGFPERSARTEPPWAGDPILRAMLAAVVDSATMARVTASFEGRGGPAVQGARGRYAILEQSLGKLAAAGARIVLGADTGLQDHFFGYAEQVELELMVRAGMSPAQALAAATGTAAAYLGRADLGVLEPGRRADFLVLEGNPIDDIRNTRKISRIFLRGEEVDRAALAESLGAPR